MSSRLHRVVELEHGVDRDRGSRAVPWGASSRRPSKPISLVSVLFGFYHGAAGVSSRLGRDERASARRRGPRSCARPRTSSGSAATPPPRVDHIAARLGMSKASLYTHFRAKEEMLAAISRETIEAFTRDLSLVLASRPGPGGRSCGAWSGSTCGSSSPTGPSSPCSSARRPTCPRASPARSPAQKDRYDKGVERDRGGGDPAPGCSATCRRGSWSSACSAC